MTPRIIAFLEVITEQDRAYNREEIKTSLAESGIGRDVGQAGRYLSNISSFLTKKSNPHLRQVIEFDSGGTHGETKDNYIVLPEYRNLLKTALEEASAISTEKPENG